MERIAVDIGQAQVGRFGRRERSTPQGRRSERPQSFLAVVDERHFELLGGGPEIEVIVALQWHAHITHARTFWLDLPASSRGELASIDVDVLENHPVHQATGCSVSRHRLRLDGGVTRAPG